MASEDKEWTRRNADPAVRRRKHEWYLANLDRIREANADRRQRPESRASKTESRRRNREAELQRKAAYRESEREHIAAKSAAYYRENRELINAKRRSKRYAKQLNDATIPGALRRAQPWTAEDESMLFSGTLAEVSALLGRTASAVIHRRTVVRKRGQA